MRRPFLLQLLDIVVLTLAKGTLRRDQVMSAGEFSDGGVMII